MPLGHVSKDSITKASGDDHLYAMIRNPVAVKKAPAPKTHLDTIESVEAKLENKALERLRSMHLPNEGLIVVARAGKFVFLAVMLPPYILFYGIPKWVLLEASPFIFKTLKIPFNKFKNIFKPAENNRIATTLHNTLSALKVKGAEYVQWVNRIAKSLFVHLKHHVVARVDRWLQPFVPAISKGFKVAENVAKMLHVKSNKHAEVAVKFVSLGLKTLKNEVLNHFRPYIELVAKKTKQLKNTINNIVSKPILQIEKFKVKVERSLKMANEILKTTAVKLAKPALVFIATVTPIAKPIIEWSTQRFQQVKTVQKKVTENFKVSFERVKGFIQNVTAGVVDIARIGPQAVINTVAKVFEAINLSTMKKFFNQERGFKQQARSYFKSLENSLNQLKKNVSNFITQSWTYSLNLAKSWVDHLFKFISLMVSEFKKLPGRIWNLAKQTFNLGVYSLIKTGSMIRTGFFWGRIFLRYSWQEVRSISAFIMRS